MHRGISAFRGMVCLFLLISVASVCLASTPEDEFKLLTRVNQEIQPLGQNAFGEFIDLQTGSLSFRQTDIHLAGAGLPIELVRRRNIGDDNLTAGALADWHLELPHIETLSADVNAYDPAIHMVPPNSPHWYFLDDPARCSNYAAPRTISILNRSGTAAPMVYAPNRWWHGLKLTIPGMGDQDLLVRDPSNGLSPQMTQPNGSAYAFNLVTTSHWQVACLLQTSNGAAGEGFLAVSPDGTKYWMDRLTYVAASTGGYSIGGYAPMNRRMALMQVSHVQDRFGNTLDYSYDGNGNLTSIQASDGRQLTLSYQGSVYFANGTQATLTSVTLQPNSGAPRTWSYGYAQYSQLYSSYLTSIALPDGSSWSFNLAGWNEETTYQNVINWDHNAPPCSYAITAAQWPIKTGTITAPSGLQGSFSTQISVRGRSYVPYTCDQQGSGDGTYHTQVPNVFALESIVSKSYSGAGLAQQNWGYTYSPRNESFSKDCASGCVSTVWTDVVDPSNNRTRYTFSNKFDWTDGKLLETDFFSGTASTTPLGVQTSGFASPTTGPWPSRFGSSKQDYVNAAQLEQLAPTNQTVILQDGDSYTQQVQSFDNFAQPLQKVRSNTIAGQSAITEKTSYLYDLPHWVIGLPQETDNLTTGEVESLNTYDLSNVTLQSRARFGQTLMNYAYDGQGRLASFTDGNNHVITLGNYKLHVPQSINYPDGTSKTLSVDDFGQIGSITDQAGNTTSYSYDGIGRVTGITYPSGDEVAWYPQATAYTFVGAVERGIAAGHWRRTVTKGGAVTTTYFDAMLRPVLVNSSINSVAGSDVSTATGYDWKGQKIFVSYPVSGTPDIGAITGGTTTVYDVIGRPTQTQQTSELGTLTTTTNYLSGAGRQITDPKGYVTTASFQVFDQPSYDAVIRVQAPEGVNQAITRDIYGNPTVIRQWGSANGQSGDITRLLIYDTYHRLCRTVDPESGSEVVQYDGANNIIWRATGASFSDTGSCDQSQVAVGSQIQYTYDAMNRVTQVASPSGTQSTTLGYDLLGNKNLAISGASQWSAHRNKLGLITDETLSVTGNGSNRLLYSHDAYGTVRSVTYPDATVVDFAPDALGRPTQASGFASGVSYYPDGNIEGFTYGSGKQYLAQENGRQLISNFTYGVAGSLGLSEDLIYDANGNITTVNDLVNGQRTKSFSYDGLNRLTQAQANGLWGTESYAYDPLNNLRSRTASGQTYAYNYDATNLLRSITSGSSTINSFGYDQRGNVNNKNGNVLVFDALNQLLQIPGFDSYAYDAFGRRVQKTPASGTPPAFYFYNQAGQLLYQYDASTTRNTDYIYLGKKLIARNESFSSAIKGNIDSVPVDGAGNASISGWACSSGLTQSINVDLYAGGPADGGGTMIGRYLANQSSEAGVASSCGVSSGSFRFMIPLSLSTRSQYVGQAIYVHGISPVGNVNLAIGNSGTFVVPAPPSAPAQPSTVAAVVANDVSSITISWAASTGANGYVLQQSFNGGAWAQTYSGASTSGVVSNPAVGSYAYRVQSCNLAGCSVWTTSNTVNIARASSTILGNIDGVNVDGAGNANVSGWACSTGLSLSINVDMYVGGPAGGGGTMIGRYLANQSSEVGVASSCSVSSGSYRFSIPLSTSTRNQYVGQPIYLHGISPVGNANALIANSGTFVVPAAPNTPPTPSSLSVPGSSSGPITVSWPASNGATSYELYQSFNGGSWASVYSGASTSAGINESASGSYVFRVRACNSNGCSLYSTSGAVSVTIPPAGAPTVSVPSSSSVNSYQVSWSGVSAAMSYTLQEQINGGGWATVQSNGSTSWGASGKGNATYGYRAQACNAGGCGPWSGVSSIVVSVTPSLSNMVIVLNGTSHSGVMTASSQAPTPTYQCEFKVTIAYNGASTAIDQSAPSLNTSDGINTKSTTQSYGIGGGTFTVVVTGNQSTAGTAGLRTNKCTATESGP